MKAGFDAIGNFEKDRKKQQGAGQQAHQFCQGVLHTEQTGDQFTDSIPQFTPNQRSRCFSSASRQDT
jgi:hypothetical protein